MQPKESQHNTRPRRLLDEEFPEQERLPRLMNVSVQEETPGTAITLIDNVRVGDPLKDNRHEDDGYRFHDIFHISYAAILGWSPTIRAFLRRKRKSQPRIDEVEDGGRARVIEEGITAMVFSRAERQNFLKDTEQVDPQLLSTIREMTSHLEVRVRTEAEWEKAILDGFRAWRHIRSRGEGLLRADLETGTLDILP